MNILCITPVSQSMMGNLESKGAVTYEVSIKKKKLINILQKEEHDVIFTNPNKQDFILGEEILKNSSIKIICTASTGTNHIDRDYCIQNDIKVLSITTDYDILEKVTSTAEHAFALMLSLIRNIPSAFDSVKAGKWNWENFTGRQINQLTVGIVGYGRLGRMMAEYCKAFGAKVLLYDPYKMSKRHEWAISLEELFQKSDVVSLHVQVSDDTRHFINKKLFKKMKSPVYLINTSRGEIVNEKDVIKMLEKGKISGYATDVLEDEFGNLNNSALLERIKDLNIIVTPHIGGMTHEAREIAYNRAIDKLSTCDETRSNL